MVSSKNIRILGIDPGSRITGYGVVDRQGARLNFVTCGVVRTPQKCAVATRMKIIYDGLCEVIAKQGPDVAAVEDLFVALNPKSALKLGQARGVALLAAAQHGLAVHDYTPLMVKQAVVGYGKADKQQVQQMVRVLLKLVSSPSEDAADALAVAICHANRSAVSGQG